MLEGPGWESEPGMRVELYRHLSVDYGESSDPAAAAA